MVGAARVSPRDLGKVKMRTWVGILSVRVSNKGLYQAYRGETVVLMFRPRKAVR